MLRAEFSGYDRIKLRLDLLAGITVAAVALPLALAFAIASGADAAAGVITAVIAGIVIGGLGGAPYQISGPTGAMSAVLIVLATRYGLEGMWVAGLIAGLIIFFMGFFRLGKIVALIPTPVITGFTTGIAIIIALGQIDNTLGIETPAAESVIKKLSYYFNHSLTPNFESIGIAVFVVAVMIVWPKFKFGSKIPGSLAGIIAATLFVYIAGWNVPEIGAIPRSIVLENRLSFSSIPWGKLDSLIVPAMSIAALGSIESLLCAAVGGNMTGKRPHNNIELMAQGIGNAVIPFFGGVPATAAIARTSVAIKSNGATRLTSVFHALVILSAILILAPLIGMIPMSSLAGVLLVTAWRMNEWHAIRFFFGRRLKHAIAAFVITMVATVLLDLTQAILIGFAISSLIFMTQMSDLEITRQPVDWARANLAQKSSQESFAVYYISGALFFGAARRLLEAIENEELPSGFLILSMRGVSLIDATGIGVLRELVDRQRSGGGDVYIAGLNKRAASVLERCGFIEELGPDKVFWSTDVAITHLGGSISDGLAAEEIVTSSDSISKTIEIEPFAERIGDRDLSED